MILLLDGLSIIGAILFFRIPFVIESLYSTGQWVTVEPVRTLKPWESISLT
jgi:hypothetical protein